MRLVGGNNTREGRVEVCFGETWATICDAFWSTADANVVCQQLGYSSNGRNVTVFMYEYKFLTDILQFPRDTSDFIAYITNLYSCVNFCFHCFPFKVLFLIYSWNLIGALAFTGAYFGQGIGHHQVGSFLCNGTESHLLQCLHSTMKCAHSNDAGVRCSAGSKYQIQL